jgi:N-methylhydantoinase A
MLRALRAVSSERGRDPRQYVVAAFGGNGPLFGPLLAEQLGSARVVIPPHPGLYSAVGLLLADVEREQAETLRGLLQAIDPARVKEVGERLAERIGRDLGEAGFPPERRQVELHLSLRYAGQTHALMVPMASDLAAAAEAFAAEHERTYGHRAASGEPVELVAVHVRGRGRFERPWPALRAGDAASIPSRRRAYFGPAQGWAEVPVLGRADLAQGVTGPCIVEEYDSTCLVPSGATARRDEHGNIDVVLRKAG